MIIFTSIYLKIIIYIFFRCKRNFSELFYICQIVKETHCHILIRIFIFLYIYKYLQCTYANSNTIIIIINNNNTNSSIRTLYIYNTIWMNVWSKNGQIMII